MDLSIVIPLFNESDSIFELNKKINEIISNSNIDVEIIYVDDGSKDDSWKKIADISEKNQNIIAYQCCHTLQAIFTWAMCEIIQ